MTKFNDTLDVKGEKQDRVKDNQKMSMLGNFENMTFDRVKVFRKPSWTY